VEDEHWNFEEDCHEEIETIRIVEFRGNQVLPHSKDSLEFIGLDYVRRAAAEIGLDETDEGDCVGFCAPEFRVDEGWQELNVIF